MKLCDREQLPGSQRSRVVPSTAEKGRCPMLDLVIGLSSLVAVVSLVAIIRPFPSLRLPTRKRAFIVFLLASLVSGGAKASLDEDGSNGEAYTGRKKAKRVVVPSDITFEEIDEKFGTESSMTDLQKEEAWKAYKNKCIEWTGSLAHLDSGVLGGFSIGMKHKSTTFTYDVLISAPDSQKDLLMT